ncbi:MAG: SO_0444 family Cu/Zn efflux transporter [Bacteroidales bacterium]|nr:SO_0444 family Cu/Zn efflux transporter [Bacteroidales bacterium]MCK4637961.1 SO_0444 family Cu/Zn efflux transporter [Bacteroidales bacterium]
MLLISDIFKELIILTNEMSPYLLLGFLFAGILHVFIRKEKITKYLGKKNLKSVIYASLFGIPLPLCSCGVIPTGISFHKDGASKGASISFLISTPQTGIDSIMVTYSLLGLPFTIIRPVVALITGVFGGLITNITDRNNSGENTEAYCCCKAKSPERKNPIVSMLKYAFVDFLQDISKWLVIGLVIAAIISVFIPDDFFTQYIGNDYLSMLIILVASIPIYVCATGSVPIVAVLLLKGLSPGAALVFLMAGPATNAATITVIGKILGKKTLISYLISIIGGALLFGILIDNFLPRELFFDNISICKDSHSSHLLPYWLKISSSIILLLLIINGMIKKYISNRKIEKINDSESFKTSVMKKITITVKGMTCNHCKAIVEKNLSNLKGISKAEVDLAKSQVSLTGNNINMEKVKSVIESLGYEYR